VPPPRDPRFVARVLPGGRGGLAWQQRRLRPASKGVDVLFAPYAAPLGARAPVVIANLGIYEGDLAIPGWRARMRSWHFARSARSAAAVIANSASTRRELERHYGVPQERVTVVWPGVDERFAPEAPEGQVRGGNGSLGSYLLFVGKLSHRRHVPEVLEALAEVRRARADVRLVVVGPDTSGVGVPARAAALGLGDAVTYLPHVEQDELAELYRGAAAFVLPTEAEGFSFTIPEALASGTPVVTLRHDALVEAGLEGAVVALPDADPGGIARAVLAVLDDPQHAARLREAGLGAVRRLSWAENARRTMDVLAGVARR
jgi:glycosyltransferase involved in cell wall biosynthesis